MSERRRRKGTGRAVGKKIGSFAQELLPLRLPLPLAVPLKLSRPLPLPEA